MDEIKNTISNALEAAEISKQNMPTIESVLSIVASSARHQRQCFIRLWNNELIHELITLGFNITICKDPIGIENLIIKW